MTCDLRSQWRWWWRRRRQQQLQCWLQHTTTKHFFHRSQQMSSTRPYDRVFYFFFILNFIRFTFSFTARKPECTLYPHHIHTHNLHTQTDRQTNTTRRAQLQCFDSKSNSFVAHQFQFYDATDDELYYQIPFAFIAAKQNRRFVNHFLSFRFISNSANVRMNAVIRSGIEIGWHFYFEPSPSSLHIQNTRNSQPTRERERMESGKNVDGNVLSDLNMQFSMWHDTIPCACRIDVEIHKHNSRPASTNR